MWPYRQRPSSRFSIENFERESTALMQMRYPQTTMFSESAHRPSLQTITRIRESAKLVISLPPDLQRAARDSYAVALRIVFITAMCSTLMAYIVRLAVSPIPRYAPLPADSKSIHRSQTNPWTNQSLPSLSRRALLRRTLKIPSVLSPPPWKPRSIATVRAATNERRYLGQKTVDRTLNAREGFLAMSLLMVLWTWKATSLEVLLERIERLKTTAD